MARTSTAKVLPLKESYAKQANNVAKTTANELQTADKKEKFLTADDLIKKSTASFGKCSSTKDRLGVALAIVENSIPIAEGLFRHRPTQSNSYALSNLLDKSPCFVTVLLIQLTWGHLT